MAKRIGYLSYLLRMWQTHDDQALVWRASVEPPGSGERRGFASLDDLFQFLRDQAGPPDRKDEQNEKPKKA